MQRRDHAPFASSWSLLKEHQTLHYEDNMGNDFEFVVDAECGLARGGACMFSLWRGTAQVANVKSHIAIAEELLRSHPKFGVILVIEAGARPPALQAWREIEAFYTQFERRITCLAQVLEATGFGSSAARSAMSAILSRKAFPAKVFAKTAEAVPWVAGQLDPDPQALRLTGMALASHLKRARLGHTWQPKASIARVSAWPARRA